MFTNDDSHSYDFYTKQEDISPLDIDSSSWLESIGSSNSNDQLPYPLWPQYDGASDVAVFFHPSPYIGGLNEGGLAGAMQPQYLSAESTPYLNWDTSPSSIQSLTPPNLYTPHHPFDHYHQDVGLLYTEPQIDMGPSDSFAPRTDVESAFPSQGKVTDEFETVAYEVIRHFAKACVLPGPRSAIEIDKKRRQVLFEVNKYSGTLPIQVQGWLSKSAKTVIGTEANSEAAQKRKQKKADKLYPCYWCIRTFTTKNNLGNHVRAHMNLKISSCPCGYQSTNVVIPSRHRKKCTFALAIGDSPQCTSAFNALSIEDSPHK